MGVMQVENEKRHLFKLLIRHFIQQERYSDDLATASPQTAVGSSNTFSSSINSLPRRSGIHKIWSILKADEYFKKRSRTIGLIHHWRWKQSGIKSGFNNFINNSINYICLLKNRHKNETRKNSGPQFT